MPTILWLAPDRPPVSRIVNRAGAARMLEGPPRQSGASSFETATGEIRSDTLNMTNLAVMQAQETKRTGNLMIMIRSI